LGYACGLADVLVVAAGVPGLIKGHWLKKGCVVIDVGFNVVEVDDGAGGVREEICGDVCFEDALKVIVLHHRCYCVVYDIFSLSQLFSVFDFFHLFLHTAIWNL
jgi:hypothetical protein